jgi:Mg/Co/Ni transporter MgtE
MDQSRFLHLVRILVLELLVGLALGVLLWEAFGRRILTFKYGSLGSSVTCSPDVDRALADFDGGLRTSAVIGAIVFVALTFTLRFWWRRRRAARAAITKK